MTELGRRALTLSLLLALAAPLFARSSEREPDDFSDAVVAGGYAGFGALRLGSADAGPSALDGRLLTEADVLIRILVDERTGSAFGYRVRAVVGSTTPAGLFRLEILPLTREDETTIRRLPSCQGCPALHLLSSTPTRFPPPQIVRNVDTVMIDLLVRPDTGEKIVDVVRFSPLPVTHGTLDGIRTRVASAYVGVKRGDELMAHGAVEQAVVEYERAAALQSDAGTHMRLARCYERLDRLEPAQQEYERALRLNGTDADGWFRLGVVRHRLGRFGKAVDAYQRALKLRPDWPLARRNLGTAHVDRADIQRAAREYRVAYRANRSILRSDNVLSVKARDAGLEQYVLAKVYAAEGEIEPSLLALKNARESGFRDFERVQEDEEFKAFLTDPRLVALIEDTSRLSSAKP